MNRTAGVILASTLPLLLAPDGATAMGMMMDHSPYRHHQGMRPGGIPTPYSNMRNPLPPSAENKQRGAQLFQAYCASCHGPRGMGDGVAARALTPRPANLARLARMPMLSRDNYLMWTISDGGVQFRTAMPAFKTAITQDDRWRIIHFLRTL